MKPRPRTIAGLSLVLAALACSVAPPTSVVESAGPEPVVEPVDLNLDRMAAEDPFLESVLVPLTRAERTALWERHGDEPSSMIRTLDEAAPVAGSHDARIADAILELMLDGR